MVKVSRKHTAFRIRNGLNADPDIAIYLDAAPDLASNPGVAILLFFLLFLQICIFLSYFLFKE
jgi:hypothetical protein